MRQAPYLARQAGTIHRDRDRTCEGAVPGRRHDAPRRRPLLCPAPGERRPRCNRDREPARRAADERRPAATHEPGGGRREVDEEPSHPEPRHEPGVDPDRQPERPAAQARQREQEAEEHEAG